MIGIYGVMKEISTQYRLLFVGGIHSITGARMLPE